MNSEIVFYSLLGVSLLFFIAVLAWFFQTDRQRKVGYEPSADVWAEVSVWQSYQRLKAHQQQLNEWQHLFDEKTNSIHLAAAAMKEDVLSQNPITTATIEVLQLSKDEKYLTDLAVLGFDYCLKWAIDDFEQEFHCRAIPEFQMEADGAAHHDMVFCFRIVLDLVRCAALKKDKCVVFLFLKMSENSLHLKFEEAKNETMPLQNQQLEIFISRIKGRLVSRKITVPSSFYKNQNLDIEIFKEW